MKTALVHDWLVGMGGGEKTLESVYDLYPAPIHTLVLDRNKIQGASFSDAEVHTSFLQKFPKATSWYRNYLPFFPLAIEQFDLNGYELVLSLSHAAAKGVLTSSEQLHLCYCLSPMRYAWDLYASYLQELGGLRKISAKLVLHNLRKWDVVSANRVDHFASISHYIARRIQKIYGRGSTVIYPPVSTHHFQTARKKEEYYITISRMVPYKKIDLIVETFSQMPEKRLLVIGDGPEMNKVKAKAKKNVEILGRLPDQEMRDMLAKAKAFVFAAEEDFGIIVVEAQAAGTPVIALGKGGALETVVENETGIFFPDQTVESLAVAIEEFEKCAQKFDSDKIRTHAEKFSEERFKREFKQFVDEKVREFYENRDFSRGQRYAPLAHL